MASRQSQKHALRPHLWGGRAGTCDPPWVFLGTFSPGTLPHSHSHLFCSVLLHRQKSQQERPGERESERERAASRCQACKELIHVKAGRKGAIVTPNHCRPPTSTIRAAHRLLRPSCVSWFLSTAHNHHLLRDCGVVCCREQRGRGHLQQRATTG